MMRRTLQTLGCLMLLAGTAAGDFPTFDSDPRNDAGLFFHAQGHEAVPAPTVASLVHLQIHGGVARGRVTQIFQNPTDEWRSGVYLFPMPENAAIDALRLRMGDRVLEAEIAERQQAKALYDEARDTGVKASLLEQQRPDVFTVSVAQIGPGEEVEVELELQFEVRYDEGRFRMRWPTLVATRHGPRTLGPTSTQVMKAALPPQLPMPTLPVPRTLNPKDEHEEYDNPVALRIDIASGYPLSSVTSPTHAIRVVEPARSAYTVELADEIAPADGDFVLEWTPERGELPRASVVVEERDGDPYVLLTVLPPAALSRVRQPREAILVIDTSGSMGGASLQQAKQALSLALDDLHPFDRFNVIRFSDEPEAVFPKAQKATSKAIAAARRWTLSLQTNGGTQIAPALAAALDGGSHAEDSGGFLRQVVFITDGRAGDEQLLFAQIRRLLGNSRLFTVGIGSAPNGHFMRRAAEIGRGTYTFISDPQEVEHQMTALLRKLTAPVLTDIEVLWDDPTAKFWPEQPGDLYLGEPLTIVARLSRLRSEDAVRLSGRRDGESLGLTVPLFDAHRGTGIGKLWARRQITALDDLLIDNLARDPALDLPGTADGSTADGSAFDEGPIDADEIRRQILELALAHDLVTPYTSLVAIDSWVTGPPGQAPDQLLPTHSPRPQTTSVTTTFHQSGDPSGDMVEELIVVTSEMPLIDVTQTSLSASLSLSDLEALPILRQPWSLVAAAPGVQNDRPAADGVAEPPRFRGHAAPMEQSVIRVDGFEITDDRDGQPALEISSLNLEEVEVASGGASSRVSTPGLRIDLTTSAGANAWRGSGLYQGATHEGGNRDSGNRLHDASTAEVGAGGRLKADQLWFWGAFSNRESEHDVIGGQRVDSEVEHATGRLQGALLDTGWAVSWHRGSAREDGRGAGPDRRPDSTWNHDSRTRLRSLSAYHWATNHLMFSAGYGQLDRRLDDRPRGSSIAAVTDPDGITGGTSFIRGGELETEEWNVDAMFFINTGSASHDLEAGVWQRQLDASDHWQGSTIRSVEAGENFDSSGTPGTYDLLTHWHDSTSQTNVEQRAGWLQDTLQAGRWAMIFGLRWEEQQGANVVAPTSARVDPGPDFQRAEAHGRRILPRLGLTLALDASGRTLLRAGYGRFNSRLGTALTARLAPGSPPLHDLHRVTSTDDALRVDPAEMASAVPWIRVRPDLLAENLEPERTDELTLGVEHEFDWRSSSSGRSNRVATGLLLSHRQSRRLLERRILVREIGSETIRAATVEDWQAIDNSDSSFQAFDLSSDLELVPSGLWVNGDRRQDALSASWTWQGRFGDRWRTQGHLSWSVERWHLGSEFLRFEDPTDTVGSGDDDGDRVVELLPRSDLGTARLAIGGRWSFHWNADFRLPWALDLGLALNGREGYPLPYFRRVAREVAGIADVELTERADEIRTSDLVTLDARLAKEISFKDLSLTIGLEAFNLLGADDVLRRELDLGVGRGGTVNETLTPRFWRLGIRLSWR